MFDLFKKKSGSSVPVNEQQGKPEPKFQAISLKKEDNDIDFAYLSMKQQMFHSFKNKLYTKREIIQVSQMMNIDAEKAFEWQELITES